MSDTRAAFEAWAHDQGFPLKRMDGFDNCTDYRDLRTQGTWDAWHAATAAQAESVKQLRAALTVFADMQPHHAPRGHSSTVWAEKLHAARTALKETAGVQS